MNRSGVFWASVRTNRRSGFMIGRPLVVGHIGQVFIMPGNLIGQM